MSIKLQILNNILKDNRQHFNGQRGAWVIPKDKMNKIVERAFNAGVKVGRK